jgi:SAM-dependent methyltransferase
MRCSFGLAAPRLTSGLSVFTKHAWLGRMLLRLAAPRSRLFVSQIECFIDEQSRLLDIGAGFCDIDKLLIDSGHDVMALDVRDLSLNEIVPAIYDGETIPFPNRSFDVALLLTVLHHTSNPAKVISEAARVAKVLIIIEDIYRSSVSKYVTFGVDSLLNLQFFGHPHNNKMHEEWLDLFASMGLCLVATRRFHSCLVMRHHAYHLECRATSAGEPTNRHFGASDNPTIQ